MALSPSSSSRNYVHDVFPSFHGADVRKAFLSHVLKEFKRKGIDTFIDNDIDRSKSIGPELIDAIRGSRIAIVLLSKNYASSTWCLNELVEIMTCRKRLGQTVMNVFYKVDPTDVKKQTGDFGTVFIKTCEGKTEEETGRWRQALAEVATIAGYHSSNWHYEADMIEKIANDVSNALNNFGPSIDFEEFIGVEAHIGKIQLLLCLESNEVRMVGIWGPAGIGKTTIARALYEKLRSNFTHTAFIESIQGGHDTVQYHDNYAVMLHLQEKLLSETLNQKDLKIRHLGVAQERLKKKKVLVVLDDVNRLVQLHAMADQPQWFGPGSRIIITTQDQKLLRAHGIDLIYEVDYPIDEEAFQIFCTYAFGQKSPKDGFKELALEVTKLSGKLPLGLKVMGSYFRRMSKQEWTNALGLTTRLQDDIGSILRFSYDSLDGEEKDLFLYIACFFNQKSIQTFEDFLGNTFLDVIQGLHILAEKSLISLERGFIKMHNLLVQLGKEIVRNQSLHEPGQRQFLVDAKEIREVLTYDEIGSRKIVGIDLNLSDTDGKFNISDRSFERMSNLQFLRFRRGLYHRYSDDGLCFPHSLKYLSPKLRLLHWQYFPGTCLPSTFIPQFLVELKMRGSELEELWEGIQPLQNLKWVDLSGSENLKKLPDLSTATNLLSLDLSYCVSLTELHSSIGNATNLLILDIECCSSLVNIPSSIGNIPNIKIFLAECSSLVQLPSCIWNITSLSTFNLNDFSSSVHDPLKWNNNNFQELDLSGCSSLVKLPPVLSSTNLRGQSNSVKFPSSIGNITNLVRLNLSGCSSLLELPSSIKKLTNLAAVDLAGCSSQLKLPYSIRKSTRITLEHSPFHSEPSSCLCLQWP